jgi:hypothetical protein
VRRVGASTDRGLAFGALGTVRSTIDPRLDQLTKQRLIAGSRFASRARLPSPSYEVIVCEMFVEQRQIAPAVPIAVFELIANLLPCQAISMGAIIQRGWPGMLRYDARSSRVKLRSVWQVTQGISRSTKGS